MQSAVHNCSASIVFFSGFSASNLPACLMEALVCWGLVGEGGGGLEQ